MSHLPPDFIRRTSSLLGDEAESLFRALADEPPVSIRLHPKLGERRLANSVPWAARAGYLSVRPSFTFDPLFHAGCYYVQESSSMFLEQVIGQYVDRPVRFLDLCAAPGGKTTHVLSLLPQGSTVVANEVNRQRANVLAENVAKSGDTNVIVTNAEAVQLGELTHLFDVILADVPCSGEGMFRKDAGAIEQWSEANVWMCAERQSAILDDIWDALRPGGFLIYSTCTFNREENEDQLLRLIDRYGAESLPIAMGEMDGIAASFDPSVALYRFFPHRVRGEGFSIGVVRKPESEIYVPRERSEKRSGRTRERLPAIPEGCKDWLEPADWVWHTDGVAVRAFHPGDDQLFERISRHAKVLYAGVEVAELKGAIPIPAASLAHSQGFRRSSFRAWELSYADSIRYLQKEVLIPTDEHLKGFYYVTYRTNPIGWVKHVGNRANNLYPAEWRIRSGYLPTDVWTVESDLLP